MSASASKVVLTVLTGNRPFYFKPTIASLRRHHPDVLKHAHVVLLVNGDDDETVDFAKTLDFVDEQIVNSGPKILPIGQSVSLLHTRARMSGRPYWLHLEDDWKCSQGAGHWLRAAIEILAKNKDVGQVRMRLASERVLKSHMVTHKPIRWQPAATYRRAAGLRFRTAHAHLTFNPALVRTAQAKAWMPCGGEPDAMRKYVKTKLLSAQLYPGVFRHLGEESLRRKLGRAQ